MRVTKGRFLWRIFFGITLVHAGAAYGIWHGFKHGFSSSAWWWGAALGMISMLGISDGYHRYYTHRAFRCTRRIQMVLTVMAGTAAQGPAREWCPNHTQHHAFSDRSGDPHSPTADGTGIMDFLWAHLGWLVFEVLRPGSYVPVIRTQYGVSLEDDPVVSWQSRWYALNVLAGFVIPLLCAGWDGLWLAGFIRVVAVWHITWAVNSVCHRFGTRVVPDDQSRNNAAIASVSAGEGWHANHHAAPNSAYLGWHWFQLDPGLWLIMILSWFGATWDIRPVGMIRHYDHPVD